MGFFIFQNMEKFELLCWVVSSNIYLLFLKIDNTDKFKKLFLKRLVTFTNSLFCILELVQQIIFDNHNGIFICKTFRKFWVEIFERLNVKDIFKNKVYVIIHVHTSFHVIINQHILQFVKG